MTKSQKQIANAKRTVEIMQRTVRNLSNSPEYLPLAQRNLKHAEGLLAQLEKEAK